MYKKMTKVLLTLLLAVAMFWCVVTLDGNVAMAVPTMDEINDLKDEAAEIAAEKDEIQDKIDAAEDERFAILAKKRVLDEQIELTKAEIANIEEQIALYEQLIEEKELEVQEAQRREDEQLALYKERVRKMEEAGSISYLSVIFDAASFSDLLARLDFVFEVMNYDEELYHDYIKAKEETQRAKEELEATKAELEATKADLEEKKAELEEQRAQADAYIAQLESTLEGYEALYAEADAAEAEIWAEVDRLIAEYEAEQKRLEEERNKGSGSGTFMWPAPASKWVTSPFGWRVHPVYGTWKHHNGIDIGAYWGSNIVAADSGRVVSAYYDWSYGNFVMIDHGNGFVTLYAHMETLYVSAGQNVAKGEVLGLCGSTGTSTGAHLHFEVRLNGSFVDPLDYIS